MFSTLLSLCAQLFWPRCCCSCATLLSPAATADGAFCPECAVTLLPITSADSCPRCAAPDLPSSGRCPDCGPLHPVFRRLTACYRYGGALTTALHRLKWQGRDDLAVPLGRLLLPGLLGCVPRCDLLVPVPLHRRRLGARGYNQAGLLCGAVRRAAAQEGVSPLLDLDHALLYRSGGAPPSLRHGRALRQQQAAGAFHVPRRARRRLQGRHVLLVDDVATTLATSQACSLALLEAGAAAVEVLTLARAAS